MMIKVVFAQDREENQANKKIPLFPEVLKTLHY